MANPLSILLCPILGIASALLCLAAALCVLRDRGDPAKLLRLAQLALWILFGVGFALELGEHVGHRDWQHSFWAAEVPLECLFLGSGVMLCRVFADDAHVAFGSARRNGTLGFLLMAIVLGGMPLVLPDPHPTGRNLGEPLRRAWELAAWGFGGALPESLGPLTGPESARGVGHLPRELTVAMGTTLIAAWTVLAFCVLALSARLLRTPSRRIALLLATPPLVTAAHVGGLLGVRSPWPGQLDDPIWSSDPGLMRSYGPTLLLALVLTFVLLGASMWTRAARKQRTVSVSPSTSDTPSTARRPLAL